MLQLRGRLYKYGLAYVVLTSGLLGFVFLFPNKDFMGNGLEPNHINRQIQERKGYPRISENIAIYNLRITGWQLQAVVSHFDASSLS